MTETSSFHLLLCPPQISRTLLALVSYGNSHFCSFVCHLHIAFSAVFSCISTHPYQWNSLCCCCYPHLMDGHWWVVRTNPKNTAGESRLPTGLHSLVLIPVLTPRKCSTPWRPNASSVEGRSMLSQAPQSAGGKAVLQCNQRAATSQLQTVTF